MGSNNTNSKSFSLINIIYRFLGGVALGILILLIPITYGTFQDFGLIQAGLALALMMSCGLSSVLWGEKFTEMITKFLNGTGL